MRSGEEYERQSQVSINRTLAATNRGIPPCLSPPQESGTLLIQWTYGRSARASPSAMPNVERPCWSTRCTACCARTAGMSDPVPGAISHVTSGLLTAALYPGRVIPLRHQGPAMVVGDAIGVIPLSQQCPALPALPQCEGLGGSVSGGWASRYRCV